MKIVRTIGAVACASCLLVMLSGCAMMPGGVAPSNIPLEGRPYTNLGRVVETDSRVHLLGLIPITGANTTRDAIDKAVRSKGGDAMIGVTVEAYLQWWILVTRAVTRVEGEVIRFDKK